VGAIENARQNLPTNDESQSSLHPHRSTEKGGESDVFAGQQGRLSERRSIKGSNQKRGGGKATKRHSIGQMLQELGEPGRGMKENLGFKNQYGKH